MNISSMAIEEKRRDVVIKCAESVFTSNKDQPNESIVKNQERFIWIRAQVVKKVEESEKESKRNEDIFSVLKER